MPPYTGYRLGVDVAGRADQEVYDWDGPAEVVLWAQPPPNDMPSERIGSAIIGRALMEMLAENKVTFVRLSESGHNLGPTAITAQVVRNPWRRLEWYLTIPDPEHHWRVLMTQTKWWA